MNENIKWGAAAVAVVGLSVGSIVYFSLRDPAPPAETPVAVVPAPAPVAAAPEADTIKHPLAEPEKPAPLPPLNESDAPMQGELADLIGPQSVEKFFLTEDLVRHVVVSVDNLSTEKVAERLRPVKPAPGKFEVSGTDDALVLDPSNYERYKPAVQLIRSIDAKRLAGTYARNYPLFQEAYESLGHPPKYFNDRLIEVIDHLLQTPDVRDPIALAQPNVQYEFADPKLEALTAGQKTLIRMGSDNAAAVKAKLRELRVALLALPRGP